MRRGPAALPWEQYIQQHKSHIDHDEVHGGHQLGARRCDPCQGGWLSPTETSSTDLPGGEKPASHGDKPEQLLSPAPATRSQPGLSPVPRWAQGNPGPSWSLQSSWERQISSQTGPPSPVCSRMQCCWVSRKRKKSALQGKEALNQGLQEIIFLTILI